MESALTLSDLFPSLMALLAFFAVYTLNGIRAEVREVKNSLKAVEADLRGGVGSLDRRITVIETYCNVERKCGKDS